MDSSELSSYCTTSKLLLSLRSVVVLMVITVMHTGSEVDQLWSVVVSPLSLLSGCRLLPCMKIYIAHCADGTQM